ncbi:YgjV family protein [Thermodesulfobacteriota bacterium]
MVENQILAQVIGFVAFLFVVLSFQNNKRSLILLFLIVAQTSFVLHFVFLGAWTAVAMNAISAVRTCVFHQKDSKGWAKKRIWFYSFFALFWIVGFLVWEGPYSLFPILAMSAETIGLWMEKTRHIRLFSLIPRPLWFIYCFIVGSYAGMLTETFVFCSIIIGIFRFDLPEMRKEK